MIKKGAGFGVDARIALVIFSILGVVGAYYTVDNIKLAQEESLINQVETLRAAAKQNIADNGFDYNISNTQANDNIFNLNENATNDLTRGRNNQNYLEVADNNSQANVINISTPEALIQVDSSNLYASVTRSAAAVTLTDCLNTSASCFYFIKLSDVNESSFVLLEQHFDNTTTGFADSTAVAGGIIVAPVIDIANDKATVYVNVGSRM